MVVYNRLQQVRRQESEFFDVLIVGGGINGAVSAASLASRGAKVALIDKGDFGSCTSQSSSNLIWGGIKYLESYEFPLVYKLCRSRNLLLKSYPSMIHQKRFFAPLEKGMGWKRSAPILAIGTWIYWLFGAGKTQTPNYLNLATMQQREPFLNLKECNSGIEYSDAMIVEHDARFVFHFVRSAIRAGAAVANYVRSSHSQRRDDGIWYTKVDDQQGQREYTIRSKVVINAAGPFVDGVNRNNKIRTQTHHLFSKGIHLVVKKFTKQDHVMAFFDNGGRLFFVIPLGTVSIIGTTDTPHGTPDSSVTDEDRNYVLDNINQKFTLTAPLTCDDIIAERCGVRPLVVDSPPPEKESDLGEAKGGEWFKLSRKHRIEVESDRNYISMFGGKLTDCLNIGEEIFSACREMGIDLRQGHWFGGELAQQQRRFYALADQHQLESFARGKGDLFEPLKDRWWRRYQMDSFDLLERLVEDKEQQKVYITGGGYPTCELEFIREREMVVTLEDFLRRRTRSELVIGKKDLRQDPDIIEVAKILFPDDYQKQYERYFDLESSR
jgi:glycerol-3-phosphate dehydrogenase